MDRRRVMLIIAVVVAVFGAALVFLYVRGADDRAEEQFVTVEVLEATVQIEPGESIDAALAANKITKTNVPDGQLVPGYQATTDALTGQVALTTIYPGEQIIASKFGTSAAVPSTLQIPEGRMAVSINLTDTARVAGFVNPGSQVSLFFTQGDFTRMLLPKVTVLGVGSTTPVSTTTTDETGVQTTEQLPRTLMTLSVDQDMAERVILAAATGDLTFSLLTDESEPVQDEPMTGERIFAPLTADQLS